MFSIQDVFNVLIGIGSVVAPIVFKIIASRIEQAEAAATALAQEAKNIALESGQRLNSLRLELADYRTYAAREYVSLEALERVMKPIMDELKKIDHKLDGKQDKP